MASLKAEKPVGSQQAKEPAKTTCSTAPKAPASKPAPKKAAPKTQEPKKKVVVIHTHMCACFFILQLPKFLLKPTVIQIVANPKGLDYILTKSMNRNGAIRIHQKQFPWCLVGFKTLN